MKCLASLKRIILLDNPSTDLAPGQAGNDSLFYLFKKRIRLFGIKDLVAIHHGHKVFGVTQVDDVVSIAGQHVDGLDVVAIDFPFQHTAGGVVEVALLDQAVALYHYELLELGIMPVLAFGDAGFADVDADLPGIQGVHQFGEGAAGVHVHFEGEGGFLVGQVTQICGVQFLGEGTCGDFGDHQGLRLGCKGLQQVYDFA